MCSLQFSTLVKHVDCGTRTKTLEALSFHTERRHSLDSTDNPEIEENDHSKKIEELKVKLFLTRSIDGLQKSIVVDEIQLSTL